MLERLNKAAARADFGEFFSRVDLPGAPSHVAREADRWTAEARHMPTHHELMCRTVQRALDGDFLRFMMLLPPGTAKSTLCSVAAPVYALERYEDFRVILASYATQLARKMGRRARGLARSRAVVDLFGHHVPRHLSGVTEWGLSNGSEMMAAGLRAGITGNRAHFALVDDPFKGRKDAESPTIRKATREAIEDDVMTRLVPGGILGFVFTRWVEDDPCGWFLGPDYDGRSGLIRGTDGEMWMVLNIPAECEREDDPLGRQIGEYIWPERFKPEFWQPFKRIRRTWASLYQQRPAPQSGLMFRREWLKVIPRNEAPKIGSRCRGWDFAGTEADEGKKADWTAGIKIMRAGDRYFVEDVRRIQASEAGVDEEIRARTRADGPGVIVRIPQDPGQAGKGQAVRREGIARKAGSSDVRVQTVTGSKVIRASGLASAAELGQVFLIEGDWNQAFIDELCAFPLGAHDDQVDAAADAFNELEGGLTMQRVNVRAG